MVIPTFVSGFPQNGQSLGASKVQIRNNIDGTFQTVDINHWNNNNTNAGKHKYLQFPINSVPAGSTGASELAFFNKASTLGGTSNLFFTSYSKTIASQSVQITRSEIPLNAINGYSWLPGGLLMQWGFEASGGQTTPVGFPINFKALTTPYSITVTGKRANSSPGSTDAFVVNSPAPTNAGFTIYNNGNHTFDGFYWMAIGT